MASVNDDQTRKKRIDRIRPFLKELSAKREPKSNKAVLLILIQDLKDEGNQLFKDGLYEKASDHYKFALFVAHVLEERFYHDVDDEFMATLYSNGSLTLIKTNNFQEALKFSESALQLQPENMKAKYRKAQALESLERYTEALKEAREGMKMYPKVFKEVVTRLEETVQSGKSGNTKSACASASVPVSSAHNNPDSNNEWLAGTNALKTEKQRQAVLEKMPKNRKKKKAKARPVTTRWSSDSDSDSDSSNSSGDDSHSSTNLSTSSQREKKSKQKVKANSNVVRVKASEPDPDTDLLAQRRGFTQVGAAPDKNQDSGMGLDTFGFTEVKNDRRTRSQPTHTVAASRLPPVDITWPLEDTFQFRLACRICFQKIGEGIRGYQYLPTCSHRCEKNFLIIRREAGEGLNWMKIRPFPELMNSQFNEFKMCQQFSNGQACKIGEMRCTFPHNKQEMQLWYMEGEGTFSYTRFMNELHENDINTSEQLAARKVKTETQQHIPGLNFKPGARQRLSSPAPLAVSGNSAVPQKASTQSTSMGQPNSAFANPVFMSDNPPAMSASFARPPSKVPLLGSAPPHMTHMPSQPLLMTPAPSQPPILQHNAENADSLLKDYEYKIVCPRCFVFEGFPGSYRYVFSTHVCEENVLAVRQKNMPNASWVRVRERTNHRDFSGTYVMCHSVKLGNQELCRFGEFLCSFAHNEAEQRFWALEKMGKFSVTDFIVKNRHAVASRSFSLGELLKKYKGFFTFVCRNCFYGRPPLISDMGPQNCCTGMMRHRWDISRILAHVSPATGEVVPVEERKITTKGAFFRICRYLHFCPGLTNGKCPSAHSLLERDVWMLERDTDIDRDTIVLMSQNRPPPPPVFEHQQQTNPAAAAASGPATQAAPAQNANREKVPHTVREYCGTCWSNGTKSLQDGSSNRCVKGHSNFQIKKVYLIAGIFRELRNLPAVIPRNLNFAVCRYIQQKKKCQYMGQGPCQFAHSEEERVLWIWMARNKISKVEDVVKRCIEDAQKAKLNQGESVVTATVVRTPQDVRVPMNLKNNTHYCRYCSVQSNSDRQWEEHCASEKHMFNVNSDKDHQWNFRQPPWGQGSNLELCSRHMAGGCCQFSHVPDMFNLCKFAHSQEELDEWRERYDWRQLKRSLAKEQNMFSYMDQLLEKYNAAHSRVTEMSETLEGVQVTCKQELTEYRTEKNATLSWCFVIHTKMRLERVALLHHNARLHFCLWCTDNSRHQIAAGDQFEDVDAHGNPCYTVNVHFIGGMFGSFSQWVVFDFGKKPVLYKKMNVELGQAAAHEKVKDLREKLAFDRWTDQNRQVVPFFHKHDDFTSSMMKRYKEPSSDTVVTQDSMRELNRHNYVHKMHKMLELEEVTRHKLISSFNLVCKAKVKDEMPTEKYGPYQSRQGELFLKVPLTENLTEDTGAGKLILTNVRNVLLTRSDCANKNRVYEALVEGRGKDYVFLCLSSTCVHELQLKSGTMVEVEVQFQISRLRFIHMHYALDALTDTDIVFPDITKINPKFNEEHDLKVSSRTLNADQLQAVQHIVAKRTGYTPPFIMYGPFGTGKTETLAQAAMVLLRQRPESRILICAQSNSAADLYITKHLDPYLRKNLNSQGLLLRLVSKDRRIISIPEGSRKYCCYSPDGRSFEIPSASIVLQHRIVVTTVEMSLHLMNRKLKGEFTHIFVDEAAQALECETIMPLTLATDKTCIVLTGDHLQISPKVYSAEARRQNFGMSMLERLFQYYCAYYPQSQDRPESNPLNIFLSINYRTKMEILRFISAIFYGGPEKLKAGSSIPSVVELTPMQLYAVQGREVQDSNSTSLYNTGESSEVVERVLDLINNWPQEWGRFAPEEIGVVTPYQAQVKQIRNFFKNHRRSDLRWINVETVQNIQGKEYRALFISTVRTRNLLSNPSVIKALKEADAVGGITDFAFLSDHKLLNTALTRAKSLVTVIGDPVALCAIGDCSQFWRTYLKHCTNMSSVHPSSMTYDNVKSQVIQLQMSPLGEHLREIEVIRNQSPPLADQQPSLSTFNTTGDGGDAWPPKKVSTEDIESRHGAGDAFFNDIPVCTPPHPETVSTFSSASNMFSQNPSTTSVVSDYSSHTTSVPFFETDPSLLPSSRVPEYVSQPAAVSTIGSDLFPPISTVPSIIPEYSSQPAPVTASVSSVSGHAPPRPLKPLSKLKMTKPATGDVKVPEFKVPEFKVSDFPIKADDIMLQLAMESLGCGNLVEPLKVECVSVVLEDGQAVITYDGKLINEDRRRTLLQAAASGREFDGDSEIYVDKNESTGVVTKFYNFTEQTLQALLHNQPDQFKRCIIHLNGDNFVAKALDPLDPVQNIEINGTLCRGRAFINDQVVVQILSSSVSKENNAVQGQVVGILQRAVDHRYHSMVCTANGTSTSLLTPIDPGLPRIYNVLLGKHLQQVKKGYVCVYQLKSDETLSFSHYERVGTRGAEDKFFVVRYLKWLPGFFNPVGVVVGVIPVGLDLNSALRIVDIEHHLPQEFSRQVNDELQSRFHDDGIPTEVYQTRKNLTQTWTFTIDPLHTSDLEIAFSIDQVSDTSYQVCVHVSDVAFFVQPGSALDIEAQRRGASFLPMGRDQIPMLPSKLNTELCSLQSNKDRCTLSVFMIVAGSGEEWHVVQTTAEHTIVNSKHRFTLQDVEDILDDMEGAESDYLKSCVLVLYQIAQMRRRQRKGIACYDPELGPAEMSTPRAHHMMKELLIMTNHQLADMLLKAFPQCTPLLQQGTPNPEKLEAWKLRHAAVAIHSAVLNKPFLEGNKICTCEKVCLCVYRYMQEKHLQSMQFVEVLLDSWKQAVAAAPLGDTHAIQSVVASPDHQPQCMVALRDLHSIIPAQQIVCSGEVDLSQQGHYSLNLPCITNMTSPLHSYVSIIVQRLLSAYINDQPCPYTQLGLAQLMATCNRSLQRANSFTSANDKVHLAVALQTRPLALHAVVKRLDSKSVELCFPHASFLAEKETTVTVDTLGLSDVSSVSSDKEQAKLTWKERIYDTASADYLPSAIFHKSEELCPHRFICRIPSFQWQKLLVSLRDSNEENHFAELHDVQESVVGPMSEREFALDVSSESPQDGVIQHFKDFSLSLCTGSVVQVQFSAQLCHGLLLPQLQLFSLTPTLDVCIEHRNNPSGCFAESASCLPMSKRYPDEKNYRQQVLPVLALEGAETAVGSQASAVIHNVTVTWSRDISAPDERIVGQFSLSHSFCKQRQIFLSQSNLPMIGLQQSVPVPLGLLCVRYKGLEMADKPKLDKQVSAILKTGSCGSWVGHCVVDQISHDEQGLVTVQLHLTSSSVTMPSFLLDSAQVACTVEWIPKTKLSRQMEYGVACLSSASNLARDVAVGRNPINDIDRSDVAFLMTKVDAQLNPEQREAIQTALQQPITVIKGPAGSGKTAVAAQLACLFMERNRMTPRPDDPKVTRRQVLICASSDTAVDVIAGLLTVHGPAHSRLVRIYDEQVEQLAYPMPHRISKHKETYVGRQELQEIALHHIIRCSSNQYHQQLLEFDSLFHRCPESATDEQVEYYLNLVRQAELLELQQADIILATCSVSASPRVVAGTNVKQIIIDSCESCMEPESLLPVIAMSSAAQLVVLGDDRQLQPAVMNGRARDLGLCQSLVERYSDSAISLSKQYRMHQGMLEASSLCFYNGQLESADHGRSTIPQSLIFLYVSGQEKIDTTVFGRTDSFYNILQAETVLNIIEGLQQKGITENRMAVITPYMAQVNLVKKQLALKQINNVFVSTVNHCQGMEFDFVVLSTCRSLPRNMLEKMPSDDWLQRHLGLAADVHQMNVAFTRARERIVIIGNKDLLECHTMWKKLLDYCQKHNGLILNSNRSDAS